MNKRPYNVSDLNFEHLTAGTRKGFSRHDEELLNPASPLCCIATPRPITPIGRLNRSRQKQTHKPLGATRRSLLISQARGNAKLVIQLLKFAPDRLVFCKLALDEARAKLGPVGNAIWRQNIGISQLVRRGLEVGKLDMPLVDQGTEAKVYSAKAYAECVGDIALGERRIVFDQPKDPEADVLALLFDPVTHDGERMSAPVKLPHSG